MSVTGYLWCDRCHRQTVHTKVYDIPGYPDEGHANCHTCGAVSNVLDAVPTPQPTSHVPLYARRGWR